MVSRRLLRIKALKALYMHFQTDGESPIVSRRNLLYSIGKTYELYHLMIYLIVEVRDLAEADIELRRAKKLPTKEDLNPNTRFVDNKVIEVIRNSRALVQFMNKHSLSWSAYPELVKRLGKNLEKSDYFKKYMSKESCSFDDDKALVTNFLLNEIEDFEYIHDVVEEMSIMWDDDLEFATSQSIRSISALRSNDKEVRIAPLYKDKGDEDFASDLLSRAITNHDRYMEYIDQYTQNWDVERIAFMDRLLMLLALVEIIDFPTIPTTVTLNEYIEISKYYSTTNSSFFINGVLDKIISDLKSKGEINKD